VVFLLEDDSIQARAEDLNGRLVELFGEDIRIQVVFILNESAAPPNKPDQSTRHTGRWPSLSGCFAGAPEIGNSSPCFR